MLDGDPANQTLSMGHVVRSNTVVGKVAPPTAYGNAMAAINVGGVATPAMKQHFGSCLMCIRVSVFACFGLSTARDQRSRALPRTHTLCVFLSRVCGAKR